MGDGWHPAIDGSFNHLLYGVPGVRRGPRFPASQPNPCGLPWQLCSPDSTPSHQITWRSLPTPSQPVRDILTRSSQSRDGMSIGICLPGEFHAGLGSSLGCLGPGWECGEVGGDCGESQVRARTSAREAGGRPSAAHPNRRQTEAFGQNRNMSEIKLPHGLDAAKIIATTDAWALGWSDLTSDMAASPSFPESGHGGGWRVAQTKKLQYGVRNRVSWSVSTPASYHSKQISPCLVDATCVRKARPRSSHSSLICFLEGITACRERYPRGRILLISKLAISNWSRAADLR